MHIDKAVELKNRGKVSLNAQLTIEDVKTVEEVVVEVKAETAETPVLTVEEMKAKLDEAGVTYHHASKEPKLTELMKENNIV